MAKFDFDRWVASKPMLERFLMVGAWGSFPVGLGALAAVTSPDPVVRLAMVAVVATVWTGLGIAVFRLPRKATDAADS